MKIQKYLPLGSVVLLKGGQHRLMVVGFCPSDEERDGKIYDYMGCFFPEGIFTLENSLVFNHEDIDEIYYMGYSDNEEKQFKTKLSQVIEKYVGKDKKLKVSSIEMIKKETANNKKEEK